ncbi:hypothetical protein BDZ94DRAFT_1257958 [Collybia nuda]|uniref:Uncharacterized protein n=1 Tax=Collybia nuda TaxID=64659 RepID=A0A9P5Y9H2_9AGAR|nr:hypothetical protein BDZ94DRAFT_1257958 [Collybia nuda]
MRLSGINLFAFLGNVCSSFLSYVVTRHRPTTSIHLLSIVHHPKFEIRRTRVLVFSSSVDSLPE